VGEVDDAVEAVVLDELERGIHLVRAEVVGGRVEPVAAADVAVHDGGAAQRGGGLGRGLAGLDDDPEHGRVDEAQRLAHPAEVVRLRGAGARGRDDDEQLLPAVIGGGVVVLYPDGKLVAKVGRGRDGVGGGVRRADVRGVGQVGEEVEEAEEGAEQEEGGEAGERAAGEEEEGVRVAGGEVVLVGPRGGGAGGGVTERGGGRGGGGEGVVVAEQVLLGRRMRPADGRHEWISGW